MEENKAQKTPINLSFADKLKMTIEVSGWKQSEIATLLGVGQKSVSFWVRGIKNPGKYNGNNIDLVYQRVVVDKIATNKVDFEALRDELARINSEVSGSELESTINLTIEQYEVGKGTIYELEKTNVSYVYLLPSAGVNKKKWAICGGRSLLFYKYFLAQRMKRNGAIRADLDKKFAFRHGVVSINDYVKFMNQARLIGYTVDVMDSGIIVVKLGMKFKPEEIKDFEKMANQELLAVSSILKPKMTIPKLSAAIRNLESHIPANVKKLDEAYRGLIFEELARPALEISRVYHRMANGRMETTVAKEMMIDLVDKIAGVVTFMDNSGLMTLEARVRMSENIVDLMEIIEKEVK